MAKVLQFTHSWGPATANPPGVVKVVGTLTSAPTEVAVTPNASYRDTWSYVGRMLVQIAQGQLVGVVQDFVIPKEGNLILFPRVGLVDVGPPAITQAYTLLFEPFEYISEGTITVSTEDARPYRGRGNWGGGNS